MSNLTAATIPAKFRKAVRIASETSLRAGELHNSITDGEQVTVPDIRELGTMIVAANSKRKSLVDASTAAFFFDAAGHFGKAADAVLAGDQDAAAEQLDLGAAELEKIEEHVEDLFRR